MANDQTNPGNDRSQSPGAEGDKTKLYAGKYKTPEELEAAYKESERKMHETAQQYQAYRDAAEPIINRFREPEEDSQEYGSHGRYVPVSNPQGDRQADEQLLGRFYQEPSKVLREIEESAVRKAEERILKRTKGDEDLKTRVANWNGQNADVTKYPELMEFYVKRTDARLAPETRLDRAAEQVRKRILELKGQAPERLPNPGEHVDEPSRGGGDAPRNAGGGPAPAATGEQELASYAAQRNSFRATKRLGSHRS